jgi:hypothetical protein
MVDVLRRGSFLFWAKSGILAPTLDVPIQVFDPDPLIRANYGDWKAVWHSSQVVGFKDGEPIIDEAQYPMGNRQVPLSQLVKEYGPGYRICNWLPEITQETCDNFVAEFKDYPYAPDSYLWVTLNRLSRNKFPRIAAHRLMCWDRTAAFAMFCGRPIMHYYEQAYEPVMIMRITDNVVPCASKKLQPMAAWYKYYVETRRAYAAKKELLEIEGR